MKTYTIPLSPTPQTFNIFLAVKEYRLTVRWNAAPDGGWFLDFATADKGEAIVSGVPVVTGVNLFGPYEYLGLRGGLVCYSELSDTVPTFENLGVENTLLFVVYEEGEFNG